MGVQGLRHVGSGLSGLLTPGLCRCLVAMFRHSGGIWSSGVKMTRGHLFCGRHSCHECGFQHNTPSPMHKYAIVNDFRGASKL